MIVFLDVLVDKVSIFPPMELYYPRECPKIRVYSIRKKNSIRITFIAINYTFFEIFEKNVIYFTEARKFMTIDTKY